MEWYYAKDGASNGPVSAAELEKLLSAGSIGEETLVWRDGLDAWVRLGDVEITTDPPSDSEVPLAVCAYSGKTMPESEMLRYGDQFVAPEFKDLFIQRLSEGELVASVNGSPESEFSRTTDLSLITILTQTYHLWRRNLVAILVVTTVVWLPLNLLIEYKSYAEVELSLISEEEETPAEFLRDIGKSTRTYHQLDFWFGILAIGAAVSVVNRSWRGAPKASLGEAFRAAFRNWPLLWGTRFMFGLWFILLLIPGVLAFFLQSPVATGIGIVYCVIAGVIFWVRHAFAEVIAVSEQRAGLRA
ncbi:MAG: DUF4339 domain-containing protein, partial [Verrucomicrobiae bacterium]|nr:DUF4339 domain-containing protein [Verrucomicrobiae bacterium]